jgi:hydroxymethylglutaryl-CoA reductase
MKSPKHQHQHQRRVRFSVVVPVVVVLTVGTDDDDPSENSDWEILSVESANCETTPRLVGESMRSEDFAALAVLAAGAKDLP